MGFRQKNQDRLRQRQEFGDWLEANRRLIDRSGLPECVTRSRDDWAYFIRYRYHDHGNWNTPPGTWIDFDWDQLTAEQKEVVTHLEAMWKEHVKEHPILAERIPAQKTE